MADFDEVALQEAILAYNRRHRRFWRSLGGNMTQDLQKRTLFCGDCPGYFLPILMIGGLLLQIAIGIIAMLAMHELLKMRGLRL